MTTNEQVTLVEEHDSRAREEERAMIENRRQARLENGFNQMKIMIEKKKTIKKYCCDVRRKRRVVKSSVHTNANVSQLHSEEKKRGDEKHNDVENRQRHRGWKKRRRRGRMTSVHLLN